VVAARWTIVTYITGTTLAPGSRLKADTGSNGAHSTSHQTQLSATLSAATGQIHPH